MFKFSKRSRDKFKGVHPDLVKVAEKALELTPYDFGISEGVRTFERQKELVEAGKSRTMYSRHLTGQAIDFFVLVNGEVTWDFKYYKEVADAFKRAANELGIAIEWGGDWKSFLDGPHIQLKRV